MPKTQNDLELKNYKLAYTIIDSLLSHNTVLSDLIALMAQVLDEDTQRALTNTGQWEAYLDSRRALDITRLQIEKFTEELQKLEGSE
jgi:predicted lipid carrier protein YhbT